MASCTNCGKELRAGGKFCEYCGTPTPQSEPVAAQPTQQATGQPIEQPVKQTVEPPVEQATPVAYKPPAQESVSAPSGSYQAPGQEASQVPSGSYQAPQGSYQPPAPTTPTPPAAPTPTQPHQQYQAPQQQYQQPQQQYQQPQQQYQQPQQQYQQPQQQAYQSAQPAVKQRKPVNKKIFLFGGIGIAVVIIIVAAVLLLGKGGGKVKQDPYLGLWTATEVEMEGMTFTAMDVFGGSMTLELSSGGKMLLLAGDEEGKGTWSKTKDGIELKFEGFTVLCEKDDDKLVMPDYLGTGMAITFERNGSTTGGDSPITSAKPTGGGLPKPDPDDPDNPEDVVLTVLDLWDGTWYGYFWITDAYGDWSDYSGYMADAYMYIDIDSNGNGTIEIDYSVEDGDYILVEADITSDMYHFEAVNGMMMDAELDVSNWWIGLSPVAEGNLVVIADTYTDPEGDGYDGFEYMFKFRPYGELWDEEEREGDHLPPDYYNYADNILYGNWNNSEPNSGDDDPSGGGSGITAGEPFFTYSELQTIYGNLKQAYDTGDLRGKTYEEIRAEFFNGIDADDVMSGETIDFIEWHETGDSGAYVGVTFQDYGGDGVRTAGGVNSYFP